MRLVTVSFLLLLIVAALLTAVSSEFQQSVLPLEKKMSPSNSYHSHGLYDIHLGLHPYVQYGGRSDLEIEVEFHERTVPLSTPPAIFRYHHSSLLSVWFFPCLPPLNYFCTRSNWKIFDQECLSGVSLQRCRSVISHLDMKQGDFIFFAALTSVGLAASESKFGFPFLVWGCVKWQLPVILTLRTWAVWNRNRRLTVILPILFTLSIGLSFVIMCIYYNSIKCRCSDSQSWPSGWFILR